MAPPGDVERGSGGGALRTPIFSKGLPRHLVDINIEASTEVKAADPLRARNPARSNREGLPLERGRGLSSPSSSPIRILPIHQLPSDMPSAPSLMVQKVVMAAIKTMQGYIQVRVKA